MNAAFIDAAVAALAVWSAQVFLLVAAGALAALALEHPKARLLFWQGLLLLSLLLPAVAPWKASPVEAITTSSQVIVRVIPLHNPAPGLHVHWQASYWLLLVAAGTLLRLLWIGAGFLRLRGYRESGLLLPEPPLRSGPSSLRWYVSDAVPGPVAYGWRHPAILLPRRVLELPADLREAIASHELVHIERRDWLWVLTEEVLRSLLWFHPAVWYALSRIQLAREQVVDREAVARIRNRDCYLDALVAVAGHKLQPDLSPAPLFLKKRHLAVRVAEILKEVSISRFRVGARLAAACSATLLSAMVGIWLFPFVSPAQTVADDPGITVDPGATLLHRSAVHYPPGSQISGIVTIDATTNAQGEVTDAHVVSGPEELRRQALEGVLQWHYSTESPLPSPIQISIQFADPSAGTPLPALTPLPIPSPGSETVSRIKSIEFVGVSPEAEQELRNRLGIHEGDTISSSDMRRIYDSVREYDQHLRASFALRLMHDGTRDAALRIGLLPQANGSGPLPAPLAGGRGPVIALGDPQAEAAAHGKAATAAAQARAAAAAALREQSQEQAQRQGSSHDTNAPGPPAPPARIRVGGNVQAMSLIEKLTPEYPADAKRARIQGMVRLAAVIGTDGTVKDVQLISGHPLLAPAAISAVKQWVYRPTLLNGAPTEVLTEIDVNFTLTQ